MNKHFKPILASTVLCAILLVSLAFWYVTSTRKATDSTYVVATGAISVEVKSTGTVKAAKSVDLSFEKSGRIVYGGVSVGDDVNSGQLLASVDSSDLSAALDQANANVAAQEAKLNELKHGARSEQIQIQQTAIDAAQSSLLQARKAAVVQINNLYVSSDSAIHTTADALFNNPRTSTPLLELSTNDSSLENSLESSRVSIESMFVLWSTSLVGLNDPSVVPDGASVSAKISEAENNATSVQGFLATLAEALNSAISGSRSQTVIDGYKAGIASVRSAMSAGITALVTAESGYKGAQSTLTLAQNQLTLIQNGGTADDIAAQQAQVDQANASARNLKAQLSKTSIRAPFAGKVIHQDVKVGQISTPNVPVISVISDANFQIETYVPEIDIGKIKVGDIASVTLDAYGNGVTFNASVIKIDPAETVVNGISTYKVTLEFGKNDDRIRSGMTANVDVQSSDKTDTAVIPAQSVVTENNQSYVLVTGPTGSPILQKIETGKESADGMVEVLSGLKVGDTIESFGGQKP